MCIKKRYKQVSSSPPRGTPNLQNILKVDKPPPPLERKQKETLPQSKPSFETSTSRRNEKSTEREIPTWGNLERATPSTRTGQGIDWTRTDLSSPWRGRTGAEETRVKILMMRNESEL